LICNFFILKTIQALISCIEVLLCGCAVLYYSFNAQLFIQPLFLTNREHIISHYIFDAQVFLWPESEPHREEACGLFTHVLRANAL
jgi:hypothetical protein